MLSGHPWSYDRRMEESAEHRAWREAKTRAALWRADYVAQFGRALANVLEVDETGQHLDVDGAKLNAKVFADECEKMRAGWEREDADVIEPPLFTPPDQIAGELPGAMPGNPGDAFARRPPFNPYT